MGVMGSCVKRKVYLVEGGLREIFEEEFCPFLGKIGMSVIETSQAIAESSLKHLVVHDLFLSLKIKCEIVDLLPCRNASVSPSVLYMSIWI